MVYNGNKSYNDIYNLNVGQSPSLSFAYYDLMDWGTRLSTQSNNNHDLF
jgi:hypothetical protein